MQNLHGGFLYTLTSQPTTAMSAPTILGSERIPSKPALLFPNRISCAGLKALHKICKGQLSILIERNFRPGAEMQALISKLRMNTIDFDLRQAKPYLVRDLIICEFDAGKHVIFLPGAISSCPAGLSNIPAPYLMQLGSLHIAPLPIFCCCYGNSVRDIVCNEARKGISELMCILPRLAPGPQAGERCLAAWMSCGEEQFRKQPHLNKSLTSTLVRALCENRKAQVTDGMTNNSLSYFKILGVSMTVARQLQQRDDKRIGIILPPGPGAIIATLACLLAGLTPVMINYASSRTAFESSASQAGLKSYITARKFMEKLPQFSWPAQQQLIIVEDLLANLSKPMLAANVLTAKIAPAALICRMFDTEARRGDDEAILLFTSGSSGDPKGVALSHRMIMANAAQCACRLNLLDHEAFLGNLPIFHSFGLTITMIVPLLCGFDLVTYPSPTDAKKLCELVADNKLTLVCSTPTFARAMLRRAKPNTFHSVRHFIVGAEKLHKQLRDEFMNTCGVELLEGYGLTEATPVCAVNLPDARPLNSTPYYLPGNTHGSIGTPLPGIAVRITDIDDESKEIPFSEQGMIWLKGANIFSGYVGQSPFPSEIFRDGWFKTGDLGSMNLNGFITLGGRLSRFSKIGGEMVPHEGVEQLIYDILGLDPNAPEQCLSITGVSDEQKGEALVLLTTLDEHRHESQQKKYITSIRTEMMARHIPALWSPKYIVPVESIPVLASGKLDLRNGKLLAEEALCIKAL